MAGTVTSDEMLVLERMFRIDYPETMRDIARCAYQAMMADSRNAVPNPRRFSRLAALSIKIANRISEDMGGGNLYINKSVSMQLSDRNWEMYRKFNGHNYRDLARLYKLTEVQVRNIINACAEHEYRTRQLALPEC